MKLESHPEYRKYLADQALVTAVLAKFDAWVNEDERAARAWKTAVSRLSAIFAEYNRVMWQEFPFCRHCLGGCCVVDASQVTALDAIPNQYTSFTQAQMTGIGPKKGADPVQMKYPFPGVTSLKGRVAEANIRIAAENRSAAYRDAVSEVQAAYHKLVFTINP